MSDVAKLSMTVLQRVSEFLASLPEDHLADIAEGRATITYHPYGASKPVTPTRTPAKRTAAKPAQDMTHVVEALEQMHTREEGERRLTPMSVADLRAVAGELGISGISKTKKADLVAMLVERTIGARLNSAAVRRL
ncbi:Rho termination factor N-terminal domain-containing protein [Dactylosporangium sp. CA-092794]|uniref:Rho termination factor N-terminal domain-containing protein n=1 Tax=Dactylosporangium sp. CA-092794 TaxID=3239929 RepID=UPI003D900AD2